MGSFKDLTGMTYGMWTVLNRHGYNSSKRITWLCRCECGTESPVTSNNLRTGMSSNCGCVRKKTVGDMMRTHGASGSPEHRTWAGILNRCNNQNDVRFPDYGGRGIKVCGRWEEFENFLDDMGARPGSAPNGRADHSIDRIDNDGDYCPENCRWSSNTEQARNKRSNVNITHNGVTLCLTAWSERLGVPYTTIMWRRRAGWSDHEILLGKQ